MMLSPRNLLELADRINCYHKEPEIGRAFAMLAVNAAVATFTPVNVFMNSNEVTDSRLSILGYTSCYYFPFRSESLPNPEHSRFWMDRQPSLPYLVPMAKHNVEVKKTKYEPARHIVRIEMEQLAQMFHLEKLDNLLPAWAVLPIRKSEWWIHHEPQISGWFNVDEQLCRSELKDMIATALNHHTAYVVRESGYWNETELDDGQCHIHWYIGRWSSFNAEFPFVRQYGEILDEIFSEVAEQFGVHQEYNEGSRDEMMVGVICDSPEKFNLWANKCLNMQEVA